ncbi:RNA polymerase recycling motor ATPase HelR [Microbacterium sp. 18062]|uniref:RNA polymerase recycling motor ATPase HelR n=1 Tax=Microbacterium sp. 18062 TaxID=2681410 RepID=UPI001357DC6D|nr:RNA polymerase recycling motor ATPase HelR [Microbacterium sp. 18062]
MTSARPSAFALPDALAAKADPALIADDDRRFAAIADTLEGAIADLTVRLDATRRLPGGSGQEAMDRDQEVRRLSARLRTLQRFRLDLTLGRTVRGAERQYIGRLGLTDADGRRLLVDWRAPAAEPFFAATHAHPEGLASRRRYRWVGGRVVDYWDEVFAPDGVDHSAALDDQSAFIASLGASRSPRMRDVLTTIQADQDAIIRAGSDGALVVDGGPGTGKTVVALHRAAYLLYADPRLAPGCGGVLLVGPHDAYLSYVDDVLPSLGEDTVQICTLRDLLPEGAAVGVERDLRVATLKSSAQWASALRRAVRLYEEPPTTTLLVETPWADCRLGPEDWDEAFASAEPGATHNEARDQVWETLLEILVDRHDDEIPAESVRHALAQSTEPARTFARAWPLLDPAGLVASLWSAPGFLARCAPWLGDDDVRMLQRDDPRAWTASDLPLLDAARSLVGDPAAAGVRRRQEAALAAQREQMALVIDDLVAGDDSELQLMSMLRVEDARHSLIDQSGLSTADEDALAGPFAHIIVDEAQELTDAEWQMLLRRCPSRSVTIVGDRAQARHGFSETWGERLRRVGLRDIRVMPLTANYRTPHEVMDAAAPVIRAAIPDANVPTSIRSSGIPVMHAAIADLARVLDEWLETHPDGVACVIGDETFVERPRVRSLTPVTAKGLEFDLVALVDPDALGAGIEGVVDRYVAMTRATERLVVLR